jgi:hypothetical protein
MMPLLKEDHRPRATARAVSESWLDPQSALKPRCWLDAMITSA